MDRLFPVCALQSIGLEALRSSEDGSRQSEVITRMAKIHFVLFQLLCSQARFNFRMRLPQVAKTQCLNGSLLVMASTP